jgi:hypothetical protein
MKHVRPIAAALIFMALTIATQAQRVTLIEGNLSVLHGQTSINTKFTYDNMRVGKYSNEADYVAAKTKEYNQKEPGRGDNWAKEWVSDRQYRYEPKFNELFQKHADMSISPTAKYTLLFKTIFVEPGYNIAISRHNAEVDAEIWIVETANPGNVIAKLRVDRAPGKTFMGNDYDTGERISESYATSGKAVGHFIKEKS